MNVFVKLLVGNMWLLLALLISSVQGYIGETSYKDDTHISLLVHEIDTLKEQMNILKAENSKQLKNMETMKTLNIKEILKAEYGDFVRSTRAENRKLVDDMKTIKAENEQLTQKLEAIRLEHKKAIHNIAIMNKELKQVETKCRMCKYHPQSVISEINHESKLANGSISGNSHTDWGINATIILENSDRQHNDEIKQRTENAATYINNLEVRIEEIEKFMSKLPTHQDNFVSFTAYPTISRNYNNGDRILFDETFRNYGDYYNKENSIFVCPVSAYYLFSVTTRSAKEGFMHTQIYLGNEGLVQTAADSGDVYDQSTNSVVFLCDAGQEVAVYCPYDGGQLIGGNESTFTGVLLSIV